MWIKQELPALEVFPFVMAWLPFRKAYLANELRDVLSLLTIRGLVDLPQVAIG